MLSTLQGSNKKERIRNDSAQCNEGINTVEMVWERSKNGGGGVTDIPQWSRKLERREETQRKIPTNLGRREREDFEEKNWLKKSKSMSRDCECWKAVCKPFTPAGKRVSTSEVKWSEVKWSEVKSLRQTEATGCSEKLVFIYKDTRCCCEEDRELNCIVCITTDTLGLRKSSSISNLIVYKHRTACVSIFHSTVSHSVV
jgi:hypothetical protein